MLTWKEEFMGPSTLEKEEHIVQKKKKKVVNGRQFSSRETIPKFLKSNIKW